MCGKKEERENKSEEKSLRTESIGEREREWESGWQERKNRTEGRSGEALSCL